MFDPTAVDNIDQSTVEQSGPQYPVIQWHYGDPKMKKVGGMDYRGGWFIPDGMVDADALIEAGWEMTTWSHDNGDDTDGFWKPEIEISIISTRKRWEVYDGYQRKVYAWNDYDKAKEVGRPTSRLHVLCLVKGLEKLGPFVLTLKGSAAMAFEGTRSVTGAMTHFSRTVLRAANAASDAAARKAGKKAGKRWPYRAFWLPVVAPTDDKGQPVFIEVGRGKDTSRVVLPAASGLPDKPEDVDLSAFYIGNDLLQTVNELFTENEDWRHAWDNIDPDANDDNQDPNAEDTVNTDEAEASAESLGL